MSGARRAAGRHSAASRRWKATSTVANRIRIGTIRLNALCGSASRRMAPVRLPGIATIPGGSRGPAAHQLAPVADRAADRTRHESDRVRHVGNDRRVAEGKQVELMTHPEPTIVLMVPAASPTPTMMSASGRAHACADQCGGGGRVAHDARIGQRTNRLLRESQMCAMLGIRRNRQPSLARLFPS